MSLFGGSNNNKPVTGLFGSTQPSQSNIFGSAGNTNTNPIAPAKGFGSTGTQQQPQQQGGLFGGAQPHSTQSGGLFGGGGGGFGSSSTGTGTSPFGNTTSTNTGATGGGLFGNMGSNTGANTGATGGGLFGNIPANTGANTGTTGGGLFGNTVTNMGTNTGATGANTGTAGGGLFGGTGSNTLGTPNIFGQPPTSTNPSSFSQPQQQSVFGSFGSQNQNQQNQPNQPSLGAFSLSQPSTGTSGTPGLYLSTIQTSNPLGSVPTLSLPVPTGSLFGPKQSALSTSSLLPSGQAQPSTDNSAQAQSAALQQRIEAIVAAWNPQSPQCRFQHYFYNLVDPRQVSLYGRPPNATNDALWQQAVRENPDPSCLVPVLAVGFDDLQKRVEAQDKQAAFHQEKLKELQNRLNTLSQTHLLSNSLRSTRALQTHTLMKHRLLRLIEHLHLLIPSLRSAPISPEEEELRAKLERLKDEVQRGLGSGSGRGRINELWALLGAVKAAKEREASLGRDSLQWKVVDQEGLERLATILAEQQQGLAHLTSIINNDMKDLQIIEGRSGAFHEGNTSYRLGASSASPAPLATSGFGMPPGR